MSRAFSLDADLFMKNLKCARRGAAAGPSGMTSELLRSVLENPRDAGLVFQVAQLFATANIPQEVLATLRVGRLTALQKPKWKCQGDRRWRRQTARGQHHGSAGLPLSALPVHQYALSTRAGTECIAHVIQALTDLDRVVHRRHWGFRRGVTSGDVARASSQWKEGMQQCHLCGSSMGHFQVICGKTMMA